MYQVRELCLGDRIGSFSLLESCHYTLRWTPFSQCSLAISGRWGNNLFIYSSRTQYSCLLSACWSWRCNSASNEKGL